MLAEHISRPGLETGERVQRFVVGTGRCGSTLLSRMLAECPGVASLFEFFNGLDFERRFAPEPISGAAFAELISREQPMATAVLRRGYRVEEIVYPFAVEGEPGGGRYAEGDALPWILVALLPRLSDAPDALFESLMDFLPGLPEAPPRDHYLVLFDWLATQTGQRIWVERSGSSIDYAAELIRLYPEARFLHLHREGPEVALSMREHHAYRLPISLIYDAPLADGRRASELAPLDFEAEVRSDDTLSRILAARPPAEYFGRYWSDQVQRGKPALDALPPERFLEVSFEALILEPHHWLGEIQRFFELPGPEEDAGWVARAASLVRGQLPRRAPDLEDPERQRLVESCAPGSSLLGRAALG